MPKPSLSLAAGRQFLTDRIRDEVDWWNTPQSRGEAPPPLQKPAPDQARVIALPGREAWAIAPCDLAEAMARRASRRRFTAQPLALAELAFLLWATQGVRAWRHEAAVLRTVPSAGCRHPFESYLAVLRVEGLATGLYRYLPLDHALVAEATPDRLPERLVAAARGQGFLAEAAATFLWTALPARTEWRYAEASAKVIALDCGHLCQNLYLACEAIAAGTCAIAAYDQALADALLAVDGEEEFVVYLAPVGKVA